MFWVCACKSDSTLQSDCICLQMKIAMEMSAPSRKAEHANTDEDEFEEQDMLCSFLCIV